MKRYFKFRKDFRCNWYNILGIYDTDYLYEQVTTDEPVSDKKHIWHRCDHRKDYDHLESYCDVFLFESDGETQEYADDLKKTIHDVYFVRKEDEADTIEELINEVVAVLPNGDRSCEYCNRLKPAKEALEILEEIYDVDRERDEIYGAIWTDTGLIYAAKMNKNSEWELYCYKDAKK